MKITVRKIPYKIIIENISEYRSLSVLQDRNPRTLVCLPTALLPEVARHRCAFPPDRTTPRMNTHTRLTAMKLTWWPPKVESPRTPGPWTTPPITTPGWRSFTKARTLVAIISESVCSTTWSIVSPFACWLKFWLFVNQPWHFSFVDFIC